MERYEQERQELKLPYLFIDMQVREENSPGLNKLIKQAQATQFSFAAGKQLEKQRNIFRRRKMKNIDKEFERMNVSDFRSGEEIINLVKDLTFDDMKATLNFVEKLEADEEINDEIEELAKKQCKTDRCVEWVLCHAKY